MERLPTFRRKTKVIQEIAKRAVRAFNILPNSDGYHSSHFVNPREEFVPFEDPQMGLWDDMGTYFEGDLGHIAHHTKDNFVMNRDEQDLGWSDEKPRT